MTRSEHCLHGSPPTLRAPMRGLVNERFSIPMLASWKASATFMELITRDWAAPDGLMVWGYFMQPCGGRGPAGGAAVSTGWSRECEELAMHQQPVTCILEPHRGPVWLCGGCVGARHRCEGGGNDKCGEHQVFFHQQRLLMKA